jgi:hypothetical protein
MRIQELKQSVARSDYHVDPQLVAEALLARLDPRRDPIVMPPVIRRRAGSPHPAAVRRDRRG